MFQVVAYGICLGLSILESPAGRQELRKTGQDVLGAVPSIARKEGPLRLKGNAPLSSAVVDSFLADIRADFPNIVVSDRVHGEGLTLRKQWYLDATDEPANEPPPVYQPKEAGVMFVDKWVSCL
jgi:hypothetical protein